MRSPVKLLGVGLAVIAAGFVFLRTALLSQEVEKKQDANAAPLTESRVIERDGRHR